VTAWPTRSPDDLQLIQQPIDFLGINYYTRCVTRHDESVQPLRARGVRVEEHAHTETGWEVFPSALTRVLLWVKERYGEIPLYITENGAAFYDPPQPLNGVVSDPLRVQYFREHLRAAYEAIQQGVDLRGYFAWSLLDNFEWSLGYAKRFGLFHVDYATLRRTPKTSANFYADVIRTQGAALASASGGP
jgi:beta-glucosidase